MWCWDYSTHHHTYSIWCWDYSTHHRTYPMWCSGRKPGLPRCWKNIVHGILPQALEWRFNRRVLEWSPFLSPCQQWFGSVPLYHTERWFSREGSSSLLEQSFVLVLEIGPQCIGKAGIELYKLSRVALNSEYSFLSRECWDYRHVPPQLTFIWRCKMCVNLDTHGTDFQVTIASCRKMN